MLISREEGETLELSCLISQSSRNLTQHFGIDDNIWETLNWFNNY